VKTTTTSADSMHNNNDKMDAEMDDSSTLLPRRVIDQGSKTAASKRKAKVLPTANLPKYGKVEEDGDGNAVLP